LDLKGEIDIESDSDILEANSKSRKPHSKYVSNSINTSAEGAPTAVITINQIVNGIKQ
jgi:hypothetical protein